MISRGEILAIFALLNAMIGGTILVLPLLGLSTGYLLIPAVAILYGAISYYTCFLTISHLGETQNMKQVIMEHFGNSRLALILYCFIIFIAQAAGILNFYLLIIKQIEGFIPQSLWVSISVFLLLFILTISMRYFNFAQRLLALGLISVMVYICFLFWAQLTVPSGGKKLAPIGPKYIDLAASLIMGYSVHDFVSQVLLQTTTRDKFFKVVTITYIIGTIIYTFISYGAYAIVNREARISDPETISEYFPYNSWQVRVIEILYLVHLFTVTPEFCIIMRARFMQMIGLEDTKNVTVLQCILYFIFYLLCFVSYLTKIKISMIIEFNGSVIGFFYVFLVPIAIHIKCVYFSQHNDKGELVYRQIDRDGEVKYLEGKCRCKMEYSNNYTRGLQMFAQSIIISLGIYTIYYTLKLLFFQTQGQLSNRDSDL